MDVEIEVEAKKKSIADFLSSSEMPLIALNSLIMDSFVGSVICTSYNAPTDVKVCPISSNASCVNFVWGGSGSPTGKP